MTKQIKQTATEEIQYLSSAVVSQNIGRAEKFLTTVLIELEKEVSDDDGLFSSIMKQFWGEEKITRKYLATPDGKSLKCLIYPAGFSYSKD